MIETSNVVIINPVLDTIAASKAATNTDAGIFNFVLNRADPTHSTTPIEDEVGVVIKHKGGSGIAFKCRSSEGTAKAEGADSVQMAYMIIEEETPGPVPVPIPPAEEDFPDADDKRMTREIFTKSNFSKHFGTENLKKRVVCYFRWYNTKHPELAGEWTEAMVIVIA
jgi:hypothetical protein